MNTLKSLTFTSCQAPNANDQVRQILAYLGQRLSLPIHFIEDADWRQRECALDAGEINAGWICGLPYVWKADQPNPAIELLATPVMAAPRYEDLPIYFSDVVVRNVSPYLSFQQLRGAAWAYNEPRSHSGYNLTRYHLSAVSPNQPFFSRVIKAGSHERALRLILRGRVDASAIDSTVLETELANQPDLASRLRVIEVLGPSPSPPWVVHKSPPAALRIELRAVLLDMHADPEGQQLLASHRLARFAAVTDHDYDLIRAMEQAAKRVVFGAVVGFRGA